MKTHLFHDLLEDLPNLRQLRDLNLDIFVTLFRRSLKRGPSPGVGTPWSRGPTRGLGPRPQAALRGPEGFPEKGRRGWSEIQGC